MTKQIELEILGQKRLLVFNNYARVEIANSISVSKGDIDKPSDFLERIKEVYQHNYLLLLKKIIYAGHVGDCYRRQDATDLTKDQIAEWVADADTSILFDAFNVFLDSQGVNLPADGAQPNDSKKKAKPRGSKPSSSRSGK